MEKHLNSKAMLAVWGGILGIVSVALAVLGNPGNMAFCIACFIRDIAGPLGSTQRLWYSICGRR